MSSALARRVVLTLGALLVFRIGTYIPLPGIDAALAQVRETTKLEVGGVHP